MLVGSGKNADFALNRAARMTVGLGLDFGLGRRKRNHIIIN